MNVKCLAGFLSVALIALLARPVSAATYEVQITREQHQRFVKAVRVWQDPQPDESDPFRDGARHRHFFRLGKPQEKARVERLGFREGIFRKVCRRGPIRLVGQQISRREYLRGRPPILAQEAQGDGEFA